MATVLGIESSCDDTAAAIVRDGASSCAPLDERRMPPDAVLAEQLASQADDFAAWGGVVPEIAARGHVLALPGLIDAALREAGLALRDLDAVAVSAWPGLVGSLVTGVTAAKVVAARAGIPLVAVDHIQAHLAAVHLVDADVPYPHVGMVASGGHSHFYLCRGPGEAEPIGGTIDDAAGEAFDKAAAMLGLGYPGGPLVDRLAAGGDAGRFRLPRSFIHDDTLRLSFAGLKTALLYQVRGPTGRDALTLDAQGVADACAAFQAAVVDCLAAKLLLAARQRGVAAVSIAGGVACNRGLRARLAADCAALGLRLLLPRPQHCTDNAAMVACLGVHRLHAGSIAGLDLAPLPTGRAGPRAR